MTYHYNLKNFFEQIVFSHAESIAIAYKDKQYSYQNLNDQANIFAHYLKSQGLHIGDVIAIANTKSFEDYAMMIACLKIGITYINLDIDNPIHRLKNIINICHPKIIFTDQTFDNLIEISSYHNIIYTDYKTIDKDSPCISYEETFDGETIAYIMFTSGSTGIPKGVAVTHQNIIHLIHWIQNRYEITSFDTFANLSPMYFDNSVFDFYGALFNAATLVPIKKELLNMPLELIDYIDTLKCTIWFSVPSMLMYLTTMKVLNANTLKYIRTFTFGGEGYPKSELKKLYDIYSNRAKFINVYGPTECTCICSSYSISHNDFDNMNELPSLGNINENISYLILDENNEESLIGELCLLGPNVAKGYYNDTKRTKQSFFKFTNDKHYEKNLYKTGDLVKEQNHLLYFIGRKDNQIKHLGYRIELEEIELALYTLHTIQECAVIYQRINPNYGKIVAYVVILKDTSASKIKKELKNILPSYMIPSNIIIVECLPKNSNGKIDKKALKKQ